MSWESNPRKFTYFLLIFPFLLLAVAWWGNIIQNFQLIVLSRVHLVRFGFLGGELLKDLPWVANLCIVISLHNSEGLWNEVFFFFFLTAVCFYHITMWYRMKLVQVFVCDINLELLFGCHHWPCHHFVTCLLDFVNCSWVSQITFIPVECACSVGMRASSLRPPHKAITVDGVV